MSIEVYGRHNCGGSIISNYEILTAGHCIAGRTNPDSYKIRVGTDVKEKLGVLHEVEYLKLHENYSASARIPGSDVGIIRVKRPFEFNSKCQKIELVKLGEKVKAGAISVTSGWGLTEKGVAPEHLKSVAMPAYDQPLCNKVYPAVATVFPGGVPESFICAGIFGVENKSGCYGDSGSPMTIGGRQAGIVSWGPQCGSPKYPSVYTDVAYYHDWISKNIKS